MLQEKLSGKKLLVIPEDNPSPNIAKTTDGNIVIDGFSYVASGTVGPKDSLYSFIAKLNSSTGNIIWYKNYHDPAERGGFGIFATADGGTVETGHITNNIFDVSTWDVLVSKFDKYGKQEWYKKLGGSNFDGGFNGGFEDKNGNLNILCQTSSTDGDVKNNYGGIDIWLVKLGRCGERDEDELTVAASSVNEKSISKNSVVTLSTYPNPFSNLTNISFSIPQSQKVSLQVFDELGKLVKTIASEQMQAGFHQLKWNAASVAKGIYYIKFNSGNYAETKKITIIK